MRLRERNIIINNIYTKHLEIFPIKGNTQTKTWVSLRTWTHEMNDILNVEIYIETFKTRKHNERKPAIRTV